jgi:hypothetical protein
MSIAHRSPTTSLARASPQYCPYVRFAILR